MNEENKKYEKIDNEYQNKKERNQRVRRIVVMVLFSIMLIVVSFTFGYMLNGFNRPVSNNQSGVYQEVLNIMANQWYFASESENIEQELIDKSLYGMTKSDKDIHTSYMSKEEITSFYESIENNFVGIGVRVHNTGTYLTITTVFRNSPADLSGLQKGDVIVGVDGQSVEGLVMDEVVDLIKGEENTKVTITVLRDGKMLDVDVIRQQVNTTVEGEVLDNNIGYIMLSSFGDSSKDQLETYLMDFSDSQVVKLILDLRDNGGGHLTSVVDIGGLFLPKGTVILQDEKADGSLVEYHSDKNNQYEFDEIVILVNGNTASAAEVLTLALKENLDNVTVVGTTTYGKGTIQTTLTLEDGSALKVTTAKWNSGRGTNINGVGIVPDVVVELPKIVSEPLFAVEDGETLNYDEVSAMVVQLQHALCYLEYPVDREDGYFDEETLEALKMFEADNGLEVDGVFTKEDNEALLFAVSNKWTQADSDLQKNEAINILLD